MEINVPHIIIIAVSLGIFIAIGSPSLPSVQPPKEIFCQEINERLE